MHKTDEVYAQLFFYCDDVATYFMIVYGSVKLLLSYLIFEILWLTLIYPNYGNTIINCLCMYIMY